jgi:ferredoxin
MSLAIHDLCINCALCEIECPNDAISQGEEYFQIDPRRCTECVGHFAEPQCQMVCPVECIVPDPANPESRQDLLTKFRLLHPDKVPV